MSDLKPLLCPFCGGEPRCIERPDNIDGTRFFYALACSCGRHSACAHKMAVETTPEQARHVAIEAWNRRAQPAITSESGNQAAQGASAITSESVPLLSDDEIADLAMQSGAYDEQLMAFAYAIEAAVRAKMGVAVPMTDEQMLAAFAVAHPQDRADMLDGSPANAVERIGARNVYRRFERGIRAAEKFHGIVGKEGGNV